MMERRAAGSGLSPEERAALEPWVDCILPAPPAPGTGHIVEERVRGMLLGLAVGDALGNTSEGMAPAARRRRYGEIRDYLPNWWADWLSVGAPSDDTQMAFWTVESLLRRGGLDPADLAASFAGGRIFGIGKTVTSFLLAYREDGLAWHMAGRPSAGNGALMRIAPVVLPHLGAASSHAAADAGPGTDARGRTEGGHRVEEGLWNDAGLWADVIAATVVTHRDEAAVSASVGLVGLLLECLAFSAGTEAPVPGRDWWSRTFLTYARQVETGAVYHKRPGAETLAGPFAGSLCDLVEQEVAPAAAGDLSVLAAAERWGSGAYLLETVPMVLHILATHGDVPEEAIVCAVNDTRDNDTIAAVVGAVVGALYGEAALPARWRSGLSGRTRESDDGHVQELVEEAVAAFLR